MTTKTDRIKVFRDTVHGYISVPGSYCAQIVDTPLFQRLRRIEQTSMRALYPCAHHDRFSHSLGVFSLGQTAFDWLLKNTARDLPEAKELLNCLEKMRTSFELACLLHDCGHAPFSHALEKYYDKRSDNKRLKDILLEEISDPELAGECGIDPYPKEHELVSAICCVRSYRKAITDLGADIVLVVRMILGWRYHSGTLTLEKQIRNCVISLLNGRAIDVDKLDYASRDKWASGAGSANVDLYRLLASICVREINGRHVVAFYKSALGVIENALDAKEYMYYWIFAHHKVVYDAYLLERSVEGVAAELANGDKEAGLTWLFSVESLYERQVKGNAVVFRPTDDDIVHYMKVFYDAVPEVREWLERSHRRRPLWKSFPDLYSLAMHHRLQSACFDVKGKFQSALSEFMKELEKTGNIKPEDYCICPVQTKASRIDQNEIFIVIDHDLKSYTELGLPARDNNVERWFAYLYVDPSSGLTAKAVLQGVQKFL